MMLGMLCLWSDETVQPEYTLFFLYIIYGKAVSYFKLLFPVDC